MSRVLSTKTPGDHRTGRSGRGHGPERDPEGQHAVLDGEQPVECGDRDIGPVDEEPPAPRPNLRRLRVSGGRTGQRPRRDRQPQQNQGRDAEGDTVGKDHRDVAGPGIRPERHDGERGTGTDPDVGDRAEIRHARHPLRRGKGMRDQHISHSPHAPREQHLDARQRDEGRERTGDRVAGDDERRAGHP